MEATIGSCVFYLEVAESSEERALGLMGREFLGEDRGMIFVFNRPQVLSFWMKNTLIPLDIAYVDEELMVVAVQTMRPGHEAGSDSLPIYTSAAPSQYAIEINEGKTAECGIAPGSTVILRDINPNGGQ